MSPFPPPRSYPGGFGGSAPRVTKGVPRKKKKERKGKKERKKRKRKVKRKNDISMTNRAPFKLKQGRLPRRGSRKKTSGAPN